MTVPKMPHAITPGAPTHVFVMTALRIWNLIGKDESVQVYGPDDPMFIFSIVCLNNIIRIIKVIDVSSLDVCWMFSKARFFPLFSL